MLIVVPVLVSLPVPDVMLCKTFKCDEFSKNHYFGMLQTYKKLQNQFGHLNFLS